MKPVTPDFDRVDPAPLSGGIGMAPADVSEFIESCSQAASAVPRDGLAVVPTGNEGNTGEQDLPPIVIACAGPPACALQGDDAIAATKAGCVWCRRITVHDDGSKTETGPQADAEQEGEAIDDPADPSTKAPGPPPSLRNRGPEDMATGGKSPGSHTSSDNCTPAAREPLLCPFCGGKAGPFDWIGGSRIIECFECGAATRGYLNEDEAIAAWNRRT